LLIERAPPLTWRGIASWTLVALAVLACVLAKPGGFWELVAAGVLVVAGWQAVRGVLRMVWLHLGGTDQPLRTYIRRHLGE